MKKLTLSFGIVLTAVVICIFSSCSCKHEKKAIPAVAATCVEEGLTEGECCARCGEVFLAQEPIPAVGHTEVISESVSPTCTDTGLTEGTHCSVCQAVIVAQDPIPATGHTEATSESVAPTCTDAGLTEGKYCSVCQVVLVEQEAIPAKGHIEAVTKKVAPTCTTAGKTEGKHCSVCQVVLVEQEAIPAKGHIEEKKEGRSATCSSTGLTEGKVCSVCQAVLVPQKTINTTPHSFKAATCKNAKKCSVCGKSEGSALGHIASSQGTCNRCGETLQAKDYDYLAYNVFAAIKAKYKSAKAVGGFVVPYTDLNGDFCVLVYVQYRIISRYNQSTLYNLTTGDVINDASKYYEKKGSYAIGATKAHYLGLSTEVLKKENLALSCFISMAKNGYYYGEGAYVDLSIMN